MNIKLIVEYDGTNYCGWQNQDNGLAVQMAIEQAIAKTEGERIALHGAGRTDAGVHAQGMCANFHPHMAIPPEKWAMVLNTRLPQDIRIVSSCQAPEEFHARFDAVGKHYRYTIFHRSVASALDSRRSWHIFGPLDTAHMQQQARLLEGTHDFIGFVASSGKKNATVKTIYRSALTCRGQYLYYDVWGSGFLYNMVRIIAGTLVDMGRGKLPGVTMEDVLASRHRLGAGMTAPAQGLCLMEVFYEEAVLKNQLAHLDFDLQ
ncbi:MAG: tRNA pseudouridine(38-40) synthase TruA [Eubacteriales bacterium]|nr:tRNA pseudouridine(38-40) synthase TruA [Eubacteriales bacterium]